MTARKKDIHVRGERICTYMPCDGVTMKMYVKALRLYRESLMRNAPAETRQRELCDETIAYCENNGVRVRCCYPEELDDFMFNVMNQVLRSGKMTESEKALIRAKIAGHRSSGETARRLRTVSAVFENGEKLSEKDISKLRSCGFEVIRGGKHLKISYGTKVFICSYSPSCWRGGKNLSGVIRRFIDVECCYMNGNPA